MTIPQIKMIFFLQGGVEDKEWHEKRGFYSRHRHSAKTGTKKWRKTGNQKMSLYKHTFFYDFFNACRGGSRRDVRQGGNVLVRRGRIHGRAEASSRSCWQWPRQRVVQIDCHPLGYGSRASRKSRFLDVQISVKIRRSAVPWDCSHS